MSHCEATTSCTSGNILHRCRCAEFHTNAGGTGGDGDPPPRVCPASGVVVSLSYCKNLLVFPQGRCASFHRCWRTVVA